MRKFSAKTENTKEMELAVMFEYLTKEEMSQEPYNMCETFGYNVVHTLHMFVFFTEVGTRDVFTLREDIQAVVDAANKDPEQYIRSRGSSSRHCVWKAVVAYSGFSG